MEKRRKELHDILGTNERIFSVTAYPRMGCENFTEPPSYPDQERSVTRSLFWPDEAIFNGHPRFKTLTRNIRQRRGEKVDINIPIYMDRNTKDPHQNLVEKYGAEAAIASKPGRYLYLILCTIYIRNFYHRCLDLLKITYTYRILWKTRRP